MAGAYEGPVRVEGCADGRLTYAAQMAKKIGSHGWLVALRHAGPRGQGVRQTPVTWKSSRYATSMARSWMFRKPSAFRSSLTP